MNQKLTKKQELLVMAVSNGKTITEASQEAGYAKGESGRVTASKTLKLPHVQQRLFQEVQSMIGLSATKSLKQVINLSTNAKSEYVKLEASKDILDRAGHKPIDKAQHQVVGDFNIKIDLT